MTPEDVADYDNAVANRDFGGLTKIAERNRGTPVGDAALRGADLLYKTSKEFDSFVSPIEKAGGPQTPQGRLAATDAFKTVKDNPQYGDALIMFILGDKERALKTITGGVVNTRINFTKEGVALRERVNELGQIVDAFNTKTQKFLTPEEYDSLGPKQSALENTLGFLQDKKNLEKNVEAFARDTENANAWTSKLRALAPDTKRLLTLGQELQKSEIPKDLMLEIWKANSRGFQASNTASNSKNLLSSSNKGANFSDGQKFDAEVAASLGLGKEPVVWNASTKSFVGVTSGKSTSINELEQRGGSTNVGNEVNNSYQQLQENLAKYIKAGALKPEDLDLLSNYIETSKNLAMQMAQTAAKHDLPEFMALPATASIADPYKQGTIQALGILMNADAAEKYQRFYNDNIGLYTPGTAPKPKEFYEAFSRTPDYKNLTQAYGNSVMQLLNAPDVAKEEKTKAAKPPAAAAKAPPASVTVGDKTYTRPKNFTDAQWSAYKRAVGVEK